MASGRTVSANFLTGLDSKAIGLCKEISEILIGAIRGSDKKQEFNNVYGKINGTTRDSGAGRGGGKLQRDMVCTRGRGGKAPYSNRNLRWHPLLVAEYKPTFAREIERIEIEGEDQQQTLLFVVNDLNGNTTIYPSGRVHEMSERFVTLPKHWHPHIDNLKNWNDALWTQNSCVISALEACDWWDSVETYAI